MKIFGKWGWFWYRGMFKLIDSGISANQALKRHMHLLELHNQLTSPDYGRKIRVRAQAEIYRLQMLREYLLIRKERNV